VLPFDTFGGAPEFDWFADGFVEDIMTELSRFRDLFVVARNSAFVYRQTPRDLPGIAHELGVRYVGEGSVRARADRVRVTAQLIDAANGGHVRAESFDRSMADHFETQARIARAIVTSLSPRIDRAEAERIRVLAPEDLTAHGLAQRGWAAISSGEMAYDRGPATRPRRWRGRPWRVTTRRRSAGGCSPGSPGGTSITARPTVSPIRWRRGSRLRRAPSLSTGRITRRGGSGRNCTSCDRTSTPACRSCGGRTR
jgi:TolB-like protein